jgi:hypothetical protein
MPDPPTPDETPAPRREEGASTAYVSALRGYPPDALHAILDAIGPDDRHARTGSLAGRIADRLASPEALGPLVASLGDEAKLALRVFALTETPTLPIGGLGLTLRLLGVDPGRAVPPLVERGLVAVASADPLAPPRPDRDALATAPPASYLLTAHPSAAASAPAGAASGEPPPPTAGARGVREADGLEPILRLAALWQRVAEGPLRLTQNGGLFKRDRERIADDPALVGPIADAIEPLPDMAWLWLALAEGVGLVRDDPANARLVAAPAEYWAENAVHLPQMLPGRWLGLGRWDEALGWQEPGAPALLAAPHVRPAALLWLARLGEADWLAIEDLAAHFDRLAPGWDRPALDAPGAPPPPRASKGGPTDGGAGRLDALLLGPAYQLGLVRAAEATGGRRLVQLAPLGRYVLGLGPPPTPREGFEQFLFMQPNFEVIAYRQGLNPWLVGLFSRFLRWTQLGAALELKLTSESFYRGLESGLATEAILGRLERHSGRALPSGVVEALKSWSGRRARLTFFADGTLVEFADAEDLEAALAEWPEAEGRPAPWRVSERILLVTDESTLPLGRIKMSGSRDYRRAPEPCVEVGADGLTLAIDLARSDLFVEAELARLADESRAPQRPRDDGAARRRYVLTPGSLRRALAEGMTAAQIARWFEERTGGPPPPASALLIRTVVRGVPERVHASRPVVLQTERPETLDALFQHPATAPLLVDRLGPNAALVEESRRGRLRRALAELGIEAAGLDDA